MSTAEAAESVATRQKKKKKPKLKHVEVGVARSQSPHASESLPAAPFLQTPTQSPAPGTPIPQEAGAAATKERKIRKEQKAASPLLPPKPNLEEGEEGAGMATTKKKQQRRKEIMPSSPCASAAKAPILEPEGKVTKKKRKRRMEQEQEQEPWGKSPLPLHSGHACNPCLRSPAPEILTLTEAVAMIRERNRPSKEHRLDVLPFAQNPTFEEERGKKKKKEHKRVEQRFLSPSTSVAAEAPIREQEMKIIKKQPSDQSQEPSGNSPLPLHLGHACNPLPAAPLLQPPAPEILTLTEAAAMIREMNRPSKEHKVEALPFAPNPTFEEERGKKKKHKRVEQRFLSPSTAVAAEAPIREQEMKMIKKQSSDQSQEPSGNSPLPLHLGHACNPLPAAPRLQPPAPEILTLAEAAGMIREKNMPSKELKLDVLPFAPNPTFEEERGKKKKKEHKRLEQRFLSPSTYVAAEAPIREQEMKMIKKQPSDQSQEPSGNSPLPFHLGHACNPLPAAPLLQPPAPEILTLAEAAAMIRERNRPSKEHKLDVLPFAQNPTFEEEHGEEAMMAKKKKKCKCVQQTFVAAETPIQEQEVKVTKKRKQRRGLEPSSNLPLPLHPSHVSVPKLAAPFLQSPAPEIITLGEAGAAVKIGKRKMRKEQKVAALSFAQNPTLEEKQGEEAMTATIKKERKRVEQILSSPTSVVAETPVQEQEVKVTKKQKQRRATLPLDPCQSRCVQSQGAKTPLEEEGENDGCKGIKKSNGKKPRVRVLSKRELIQEARKQPKLLPEGFVPFSNFVASCTEQNADRPPYSAFFDQFRYNPVCEDRRPPLPRTPDRVARLPPRGYSSFESSQLAANEASRPDTTLASKTKQQDSGSGSQEKVSVEVKENPENKTREKKQRKLSGKSRLPFDPSQTCCVQLQGTKALPEEDQETSKAFKANNSVESKSKKEDSASGSTSGSQKKQIVKEKTTPEKKTRISKRRPVFTAAEKRSDKYRRVPLDQLVSPPRSPHNLLQEKYASDPWKVILICVFLNLTQGIQVKRMLEGFFERYPDPLSAINADPDKMAEYLAPLGLNNVRTRNIKKLSKQYVGNEWTHVTQLCGVGKYAADAYAIFCAGRAREVVPDDHKLVDYWNYVCFELPMAQMD
ncbi:titin isoform X2 [Hordeum vulgare subsp. vulgare]|uniref:Predicted protein n=1 Tax=Hordeum vulgare subsp. vulgare TaxID=112509 RepID=F2EDB8_HORVV|nr:titin isoform X2 [Hordeum vulgare subsp. vulgare]BAK05340.1 predicted protein [Hordeum vulgare subsp. vulgare]